MVTLDWQNDLQAQGVRFKVLAHVFPVLRHDVIGPISNAALAAAMLHQVPDDTPTLAAQARHERLVGDMESLLDEGVASLRGLDDWLIDRHRSVASATLLNECRRLVFTRLMATGKQIHLPETLDGPDLSEYSARYIMIAWLLCLVDTLAEGQAVTIESVAPGFWTAQPGGARAPQSDDGQAAPVRAVEMQWLANAGGWIAECGDSLWTLRCPPRPTTSA
ncbi:hypothetical protein CEG14_16390 [Bordetella genomosp. 1]|uniref:Uncharacterized protein n=1 Tax=Bordetella genomosp. 1 TaxID=1395607 RepID=A0A261SHU5_9BORD|nr:hypothetical protein [Bordetella genomosp. 1]MDQ8034812.1 hypothetical protein [Bordetella sp.]OZI36557.1 hypothetical protein CEG14_16390 [Bordetella genomosp. 1]OZI58016.1 hypothetical protein CAL27_21780 [Bordetella genomosp. 1]